MWAKVPECFTVPLRRGEIQSESQTNCGEGQWCKVSDSDFGMRMYSAPAKAQKEPV